MSDVVALREIEDGETVEVRGSSATPYVLRNTGGVYSCSCPAWRNQGLPIERRTCKHLRKVRGDEAEDARVGSEGQRRPTRAAKTTNATATTTAASGADGEAPGILLAHSWDGELDLTGWWMSEKLDGVRAYWDGKSFVSRLGNTFVAPDWFVEGLPETPLDGELWGGRKRFQRTVSIVRRQDKSEGWRDIHFVVFDAPAVDAPFEERIAYVQSVLRARALPHARHHVHERCRGVQHLREELARVESLGGEGLMLRRPGSRYEVGRSSTLLKVKSFQDGEARVVGHVAGSGKHKGRLGALLAELPDGKRFSIGTGLSDDERRDPPPVGSIVTYRCQELSEAGIPRFPSYVGVRVDVAWPAAPTPDAPRGRRTKTRDAAISPPAGAEAAVRVLERATPKGSATWQVELAGKTRSFRLVQKGAVVEDHRGTLATAAAAWRDAERFIRDKLAEGWTEVVDD